MLKDHQRPVALITGAAKRIGAVIAETLHQQGYNIIVHYRHSAREAQSLCEKLNKKRPLSMQRVQADFNNPSEILQLAQHALAFWQRIDVLINNASEYFPTPFGTTTQEQWQRLLNSNLTGPYFLTQALSPTLKKNRGHVINIIDANLERQPAEYNAYIIAKAGLKIMTECLARELSPTINVSNVSPGETLLPDDEPQKKSRLK